MSAVSENTLLEVFSMLMERTTKLETIFDRAIMHGQLNSIGSLDTSYLELPYHIYVHEPLDKIYLGLDRYTAFYIETDVEYPYNSLCHQIVEGKFDKALGSKVKEVKEDVQAEIDEDAYGNGLCEWECCHIPSLISKRCRLRTHLIDVIVNRYLADVEDKAAKGLPMKIYYDPVNDMTSFFVFVDGAHEVSRFAFIKKLTGHVQEIVKRIDPHDKISTMTICPMKDFDASTLKTSHDVVEKEKVIQQKYKGYPSHLYELTEAMKHHIFWRSISPFVE